MTNKRWLTLLGLMVLCIALLATGCGGEEVAEETAVEENVDEVEEVEETDDSADEEMPAGSLSVQGSDTMVNMGSNLAEVYMDTVNPDAAISVTGGGSGTGIAALINDNVDIAQVSRTMTDEEIAEAEANDVEIFEFIVGQDGLAIYLNDENPIDELDVEQLKAILTGEITDWGEFGWDEGGQIDVFSRQSNSGTYVYINENIMDGKDWAPGTRFQPGSSQVVEGVIADKSGIGYSGIGYLTDGVKAIKVANVGEEAVSPEEAENVSDGSYPIARPLFFYTNGFPEGVMLHYLEWVLSEAGQDVVVQSGFYGIHGEYQQINDDTFGSR